MNLGLGFGAAALFLLLPDAYMVFGVMGNVSWWLRGLFLLPTIVYILVILRVFVFGETNQQMVNLILWLTLCIFFPTLLFAIVSIIGKFLGLFSKNLPLIFNWIGLGIACIWLCGCIYGITIGWKKVTVDKVTLSFANLPQKFYGYKIVQLSDFHIGTYISSPKTVEKIVKTVNSLNPDLIVFTGDLVNNSPQEIEPFLKSLKGFKAPDGVLAVLGNHDYCLYRKYTPPDSPEKATEKVVSLEEEAGWKVLRNSNIQIDRSGEKIAIIGVENAGSKSFPDMSDLRKAMEGIPEDEFKILLSHDPSHWRREVLPQTDIDLMLAGHTHAMQFRIGNFSPAKWSYKEWGGVYKEGNQVLVVSTGTGGNVAFRFGTYPQILEITLKK